MSENLEAVVNVSVGSLLLAPINNLMTCMPGRARGDTDNRGRSFMLRCVFQNPSWAHFIVFVPLLYQQNISLFFHKVLLVILFTRLDHWKGRCVKLQFALLVPEFRFLPWGSQIPLI